MCSSLYRSRRKRTSFVVAIFGTSNTLFLPANPARTALIFPRGNPADYLWTNDPRMPSQQGIWIPLNQVPLVATVEDLGDLVTGPVYLSSVTGTTSVIFAEVIDTLYNARED